MEVFQTLRISLPKNDKEKENLRSGDESVPVVPVVRRAHHERIDSQLLCSVQRLAAVQGQTAVQGSKFKVQEYKFTETLGLGLDMILVVRENLQVTAFFSCLIAPWTRGWYKASALRSFLIGGA